MIDPCETCEHTGNDTFLGLNWCKTQCIYYALLDSDDPLFAEGTDQE